MDFRGSRARERQGAERNGYAVQGFAPTSKAARPSCAGFELVALLLAGLAL